MHWTELRTRLIRDRGLGENFQIHPNGRILRLSEGVWGLVDRDIDLNSSELASLLDDLKQTLSRLGHGLHISELSAALCETKNVVQRIGHPLLLFDLIQRNRTFKTSRGQYIYLADWEGPRRLTVAAALGHLVKEGSAGMTFEQIEDKVSEVVGRPVSRTSVSAALQAAGARWEEKSGLWYVSCDDAGEGVSPSEDDVGSATQEGTNRFGTNSGTYDLA
jgi:hypothetical protein